MNKRLTSTNHNILKNILWIILTIFFILGIISSALNIINFFTFWIEQGRTFVSLGEYLTPSLPFYTIALIAATVLAVLIQLDTIKLQKKEFEDNKNNTKKDNFINHFFHLLKIYENIVNSIEYRKIVSGHWESFYKHAAFTQVYESLFSLLESKDNKDTLIKSKELKNDFNNFYQKFNSNNQKYIGHYFRTLYQIIKLIDLQKNFLNKEERQFYSDILRAQLSSYELVLIFYNCLSTFGEKLKPYVIEYNLVKHLDESILIETRKDDYLKLFYG
jgi:hypothetical protein